jgi:hypothetical protein
VDKIQILRRKLMKIIFKIRYLILRLKITEFPHQVNKIHQ